MRKPFPSPEYLALCTKPEVAKMLRELWEKRGVRGGDFYIARRESGDEVKIVISNRRAKHFNVWSRTHQKTWLPRPDQLWELLEEGGYGWQMLRGFPVSTKRHPQEPFYRADAFEPRKKKIIKREGPDPACALLLALVEVEKDA